MTRKFFLIALCAAALAAAFGCSRTSGAGSGKGEVEVTVWGSWSGSGMDRFIEQIDKFNAEHTGIKAAYVLQQGMEQKLLTAIVGGGVPDVLIWDRFQTSLYAPKGALMAVDSFVSKDGLDLNIFYEEAVEEMRYNGNLYGLPFVVDNRALFYNKELFREAGLDPERPPQTWDELEAAAIKLTKWEGGKLTRAGFALNDVGLFNTWILQAGGDMLTEDLQNTAFNSPAGLAVLQYWDKLLNKSKVYAVGFASNLAEGEDPFVTGKIAIKWDGPWAISTLERYAETLDYGVAPLPAGPGGHRGARMGGFGMAIAKGAKNADQGWELVKYLTADKENNRNIARATGNIPANRQAAQYDDFQKDPHFRGIVENMEFAKIRPPVPGYSQIEGDATIPNFQLFMSGQMTAQEALADAQIKGDKILRENRE